VLLWRNLVSIKPVLAGGLNPSEHESG